MDSQQLDESLPFSKPKQQALFGHLLNDPQFFLQTHGRLKPDWFSDSLLRKLYQYQLKYFATYQRVPTPAELEHCEDIRYEEQSMKQELLSTFQLVTNKTKEFNLNGLRTELTNWLHSIIFRRSMMESNILFQQKKTDEAYERIRRGVNDITGTSFEASKLVNWYDLSFFQRREVELKDALTFGLTRMDKIITPMATKGSLLKGDSTILLAPTNVGKTITMINIAIANVRRCKKVLVMTHEGNEDDIKNKMFACWLGVTPEDAHRMALRQGEWGSTERWYAFQQAQNFFSSFLDYGHLNQAGMTVEEWASDVRRYNDKKAAGKGCGYDMIVDDYLQNLTTQQARGGQLQRRHIDEYVYKYAFRVGEELKAHTLTGFQGNRESAKVMKNQKEDRLVGMEDAMESYGPMTAATNVISINADSEAEHKHRRTYYYCKGRGSEKGWAICCKGDYSKTLSHADNLPHVAWRGNMTFADQIDHYLELYHGKHSIGSDVLDSEIPPHLVRMHFSAQATYQSPQQRPAA